MPGEYTRRRSSPLRRATEEEAAAVGYHSRSLVEAVGGDCNSRLQSKEMAGVAAEPLALRGNRRSLEGRYANQAESPCGTEAAAARSWAGADRYSGEERSTRGVRNWAGGR